MRGYANAAGSKIIGNGSDNVLIGGAGADTLLGSDGNDVLNGLGGADSLEGGAGDDTYFIDHAGDQVVEAPDGGRDLVYSTLASTTLGANLEGLALLAGAVAGIGNGLDNDLAGNSGNNLLDGGGGADVINGLGGIDTLTYAAFAGPVTVNLAAGTGFDGVSTDTLIGIENVVGTALADTLLGDALGNVLDGGAGNDTITGGGDWDVLIGGSGADLLQGDDGYDYASYETAAAGVVASLASPAVNTGDAQGDSYAGIESRTGSSFADLLIGDAADNHLRGLADNDTLQGSAGTDALAGDAGIDTASYAGLANAAIIDLNAGAVWKGSEGDSLILIENAFGTSFDDTLFGTTGDNVLDGGAGGSDQINGYTGSDTVSYASLATSVIIDLNAGATSAAGEGDSLTSIENAIGSAFNDTIFGTTGDNVLDGGSGGADQINGYTGSDTVSYASLGQGVIIDLNAGGSWEGAEGDTLISIENAIGTGFNDTIFGTTGDNVLDGGAGGADQINGYTGSDTVSYARAGRGVTIDLAAGTGADGVDTDTLISLENAIGSDFDDRLVGTAADNLFTGGGGHDTFVFAAGFGHDTIADFHAGAGPTDVIEFHGVFANFAQMMTNTTQSGSDVLIGVDFDSNLRLKNLTVAALHPDDFLFL